VHLRFGTVSIRELVAYAHLRSLEPDGAGAATWLSELIWREFYAQILWHHRTWSRGHSAGVRRALLSRRSGDVCRVARSRTGYPIVDAAMRQINASGYMHNRLRMIAASFLVKDLLVDWRKGEKYFADTLLDFDLASNNGGWQWAASTGCDAQPYFRIFNPVTQSERFDPAGSSSAATCRSSQRSMPGRSTRRGSSAGDPAREGVVIGRDYPAPIVDHAAARRRRIGALQGSAGGARGARR